MTKEVQRRGRKIVNVRGDGNCLYRALSQQLNVVYSHIRHEAIMEIISNPELYQSFIATFDNSDNSVYNDLNHYVDSHSS